MALKAKLQVTLVTKYRLGIINVQHDDSLKNCYMNCKHLTGVSLAECIAATLRSICSQASELLAKYRREIRLYLSLLQLLKVLGTIMSSHLVLKYYVNNVGLAVNYMDYGCHISDYCRLFSCPYFTDVYGCKAFCLAFYSHISIPCTLQPLSI